MGRASGCPACPEAGAGVKVVLLGAGEGRLQGVASSRSPPPGWPGRAGGVPPPGGAELLIKSNRLRLIEPNSPVT